MKAAATTGSSIHILLIPERRLPYGPQQASGSHGSKWGELQNAQSWEQAGQGVAKDQLQERGPLLKESWALRLAQPLVMPAQAAEPKCLLAGFQRLQPGQHGVPWQGEFLMPRGKLFPHVT